MFQLTASLKIPSIVLTPTVDEIQDSLMTAGKYMTGVSRGVAQWTAGRPHKVFF
jgi:hypothetical protein